MLRVCYSLEQWPEEMRACEAARMAETGIRLVRIGELAWSRMEPDRAARRGLRPLVK